MILSQSPARLKRTCYMDKSTAEIPQVYAEDVVRREGLELGDVGGLVTYGFT
jgi:hypothetical protein